MVPQESKYPKPDVHWEKSEHPCGVCQNNWTWVHHGYLTDDEFKCPECGAFRTDWGIWIKCESQKKPSVFRLILKRLRESKANDREKGKEIAELKKQLANEKRKSADFENRLFQVVRGDAERCYEKKYIRAFLEIDFKCARDLNSIWPECERQLLDSVRRELN